jgi:DNA primase
MANWVSFAEIKSRVALDQLLRHYRVEGLRGSGRQQVRGRCPLHQGQGSEAFHANLERNVFHCFACGAGGNVLDFVAAMEGCSVREAALRLQEKWLCGAHRGPSAGPAFRLTERKLVTKKREVLNPPLGFSLALNGGHPYLVWRGIDRATADHFGVGFFGGGGLMSRRVAIPIHDDDGRLVAYCGRAIDGSEPRYRFPAGFQKSRVLFNYHRALATGSHEVILVEGFFDCMRVHQAGLPCVALMGVQLSEAQKELLVRGFCRVVLLLDGDDAGRVASGRIARALAPVTQVTQVLLNAGTQPDQMSVDQIRHLLVREERRSRIGRN